MPLALALPVAAAPLPAGYPWAYGLVPLLAAAVLAVALYRLFPDSVVVPWVALSAGALLLVAGGAVGGYALGRDSAAAGYEALVQRAQGAAAAGVAAPAPRVTVTRVSLDLPATATLVLAAAAVVLLALGVRSMLDEGVEVESHWGGLGGGLGGWRIAPALVYVVVAVACLGMLAALAAPRAPVAAAPAGAPATTVAERGADSAGGAAKR